MLAITATLQGTAMALSMYDASVPAFVRTLKNLDAILDKATAYAEAKKVDPDLLVTSRLAIDMLPLARQIQIATDGAKGGAARLARVDIPSYPDDETTVAALKERIAKTVAFLEGIPADRFVGAEDLTIELKLGAREMSFPAKQYLFGFVIPNFYFHVTTTYAILRHNGVEIGKTDYLGAV
jgi:hypothetical protein